MFRYVVSKQIIGHLMLFPLKTIQFLLYRNLVKTQLSPRAVFYNEEKFSFREGAKTSLARESTIRGTKGLVSLRYKGTVHVQ